MSSRKVPYYRSRAVRLCCLIGLGGLVAAELPAHSTVMRFIAGRLPRWSIRQ
jgi:hypothetical protein